MTTTIAHRAHTITPEIATQMGEVVRTINLKFKPMRETIAMATEAFNRQQAYISATLAPAIKALELAQAKETKFMSSLQITEASQRHEEVNLFAYAPEVRRREPSLTTEEQNYVRRLIRQENSRVIQAQSSSGFCRSTLDLYIQGQQIKLRPIERAMCDFFFQDPQTRCLRLEVVERAVYGEALSNSDRLKQVIKRINRGAKEIGLPNVFSYGGGFLMAKI